MSGQYRILAVCLGNICRSPMAEAVLRARLEQAGIAAVVDSAGTSGAHQGEAADSRAMRTLRAAGYDLKHQARQLEHQWLAQRDLVLVMDEQNLWNTQALATRHGHSADHIVLMRRFDSAAVAAGDLEVPDPWYGGEAGFVEVLAMIERAAEGVVAHLRGD